MTRREVSGVDWRSDNVRSIIIVAAIILGLGGLAYLIYLNVREPPPIRNVVTFARPSLGHDNTLIYPESDLPPAGGTHHDQWQVCGIYDEPIASENAVHSLEHGAVWITYNPELAANDVAELKSLARGNNFVLMSPYDGLKSPIVLTAWGLQLEVDSVNDSRIDEFIERYQVGPQTPERGATCGPGNGGGIGQPDG
jgi:hypothetical protein